MENKVNMSNQNTQQIGENPMSQPAQTKEKSKISYWMVSTLILAIALVILGIFTLSQREINKSMNGKPDQTLKFSETPTPSDLSTNPNSQSQDNEAFLVTTVDRLKYKVILYDRNTKQLKEKVVDFATTGLNIGLLMSRFRQRSFKRLIF